MTTDSVVHEVGGCGKGTVQAAPAAGWQRITLNPSSASQAKPAISPGTQVKSIYLIVDEGPDAGSGMVVLDHININGTRSGSELNRRVPRRAIVREASGRSGWAKAGR